MEAMEVLHRCCCAYGRAQGFGGGLRAADRRGGPGRRSSARSAQPRRGLELGDWLVSEQVPIAAESTGVYWKPIWNLLEGQLKLLLVNAHDVEQLPGRKTDVKDSQWPATLELRALEGEICARASAARIAGSIADAHLVAAGQGAGGFRGCQNHGGRPSCCSVAGDVLYPAAFADQGAVSFSAEWIPQLVGSCWDFS